MRKTKRFTSLAAVALLGLMAAACGDDDTESATTHTQPGVTAAPGTPPHPTRRRHQDDEWHQTPQPHQTAPPQHRRETPRRLARRSTSAVVATSRSTTLLRQALSVRRTQSASRSPRLRQTTMDRIARNCSTCGRSATSSSLSASCSRGTLPPSARPTPTRRSAASSDSPMLDFTADPTGGTPYGDNIAGLVFSEEQGSFLSRRCGIEEHERADRFHRWRQGRRRSDREVRAGYKAGEQQSTRHPDRTTSPRPPTSTA